MKIRITIELPERYLLNEEGVTFETLVEQFNKLKDDTEKELGESIILMAERVDG